MSDSNLPTPAQIVEAMLFAGGAPLTAEKASAAVRGLESSQFEEIVRILSKEYRRQGRPYAIVPQNDGYVLNLGAHWKPLEERLFGLNREARLSAPAIDVLSLVAYRQPIPKREIDAIRGSDSGALLRQLLRRSLVRITDRPESDRREVFYATTERFLELFQLGSLDELPQTQDLHTL